MDKIISGEKNIEYVDARNHEPTLSVGEVSGHTVNLLLVLACVVFGASTLLFGFDNNVISPLAALMPFVRKYQGLDPTTHKYIFTARNQDLLFSLPLVGTIFGAWAASPIQNKFGRKWSLVGCYIMSIGGVFLQLFAPNLAAFVIGRMWNGLGYGCAMAISPLYLSEVVPSSMRGRAVSSQNILTILSGVIATVIVNATSNINGSRSYKIPLGVQCAMPVILIPLTVLLPESPVWLVSKNRTDEARSNLRKLRGYSDAQVDDELRVMKMCEDNECALNKDTRFWDIFNRANIKRTITAGSLFSFNQISGIILSTTYATIFLEEIGAGNPFQLTVVASCCQLAGAFAAPFVVDLAGRRPTALIGLSVLLIIDFIAGGLAFDTSKRHIAIAIAALSFIFNFFWTASFYALSLVIPSEIPTSKLRNHTMSYTVGWCQTTAVITTFVVPQLTSAGAANLGAKAYLVFGGCMVCIVVFVYFMLPETRNRTFAEIDEMYAAKIPMWKWRDYETSTEAKQVKNVMTSITKAA